MSKLDVKLLHMRFKKGALKAARSETSLKQADVMACLGISRSSLSSLENGCRVPADEDLDRLRRIFLLPHFSWERERDENYTTPHYEVRKRIARAKSEDTAIFDEVTKSIIRRFAASKRAGKVHLFLYCLQDFLRRADQMICPVAAATPAPRTLRSVLLAEYRDSVSAEADECYMAAEATKRQNDRGKRPSPEEMASQKESYDKLRKVAEKLEAKAASDSVQDRTLLEFFRSKRWVRLPSGKTAFFNSTVDLDEQVAVQETTPVLDQYWLSIFSAISSRNPEPDDLEWDDVRSDFHPEITATSKEGRLFLVVRPGENPRTQELLYQHGDRLPLERVGFGLATKIRDVYVCPVSFQGETKRYVQFICIDPNSDWHRSPIYQVDAAGNINIFDPSPILEGRTPKVRGSLREDTASKTASKRAPKGNSKQKRAR